MTWTQHTSKTWNRQYWFNSETKKSVWIKPDNEKKDQLQADIQTSTLKLDKSISESSNKKSEEEKEETEIEIGIEKLKLKSISDRRTETKIENDDFRDYKITNGFITTTIRARDKYEAMEEMRSVSQSLNPYD